MKDFQQLLKAGLVNLLVGFVVVVTLAIGIGTAYTFFIGLIYMIKISLF